MRTLILFLAASFAAAAQTSAASIQASGSATLTAKPDQATLSVGVTTQGTTAKEAADLNATQANAVIDALNAVLNGAGTIQTISYTISPRYTSNGTVLAGYSVTNTVQVITTNVNLVGPLIDAANGKGANQIYGPSFGLQNPEPQRQAALVAAAKQALAHAAAIASGLGGKTGAVLSASEGSSVVPVMSVGVASTNGTPIETGTVNVTANVTVTVALVQ